MDGDPRYSVGELHHRARRLTDTGQVDTRSRRTSVLKPRGKEVERPRLELLPPVAREVRDRHYIDQGPMVLLPPFLERMLLDATTGSGHTSSMLRVHPKGATLASPERHPQPNAGVPRGRPEAEVSLVRVPPELAYRYLCHPRRGPVSTTIARIDHVPPGE